MGIQCLDSFIKQELKDIMANIDKSILLSDKKIYTVNYKDVFNNKYKEIENSKGCMGVYFLYKYEEDSVKEVLYVGLSYTKNGGRSLYDRLCQHFCSGDTGGLPYKLGIKASYKSSDSKEKINRKNILKKSSEYIKQFKKDDIKVSYITIPKDKMNPQDILFLESFYIGVLRPKYNFMD